MNSTEPDMLQGIGGALGMGLMFLAPGYCWAQMSDIAGFRRLSGAEQTLWSVVLGMPLAVGLCALAGRVLSTSELNIAFGLLNALALGLYFKQSAKNRGRRCAGLARSTTWMLALMGLFGLYCVLATTDVQIGKRLYISTTMTDWSVRVQMVRAAMRTAAAGTASPPINGLTTLTNGAFGHAPHLRYYYFWYVTVAHAARTLGIDAHAALAASCAWSGWALIAAAFLAVKYMLAPGPKLRRYCFLLLLMGVVLGLDILPTIYSWVSPHRHPFQEMEWWHQDRTPSFLGAVLYAPHHMAGFAALLAGFLALLVASREDEAGSRSRRQLLLAAVFAGLAFAAGAGLALFPTVLYVFVLAFWAIDLVRRRNFATLGALAGAGVLSLLLAHPYLRDLQDTSSAAAGLFAVRWRNDGTMAWRQARLNPGHGSGGVFQVLKRQPIVLAMDIFDLGFYLLVLAHGWRRLRQPGRWTAGQCALAALIAGAGVPAYLLSSTTTSGPNDLGVDGGYLLRFGLQLAAVPWAWAWYQRWRADRLHGLSFWPRAGFALGVTLLVLGVAAQLYQAPDERFYYAVLGSSRIHKQMDAFTKDRLAERLYNVRSAYAAMDSKIPATRLDDNAVQFNPVGSLKPAETLYSDHQIASWDTGCGTSYGGDYNSCAPYFANLLFLFGNTQAGVNKGMADNDRQDNAAPRTATLADFEETCRTLKVRAIVAESTDSIWGRPGSWVWTAPVLAENETVRILGCPSS